MPPKAEKRKSIDVNFKLDVVARQKNGETWRSLEREFNFQYSRDQMRNWKRNEAALLAVSKRGRKRAGGAGHKPCFPDIEAKIIDWFKAQRDRKLAVNYVSFRREAQKIASKLGYTDRQFACTNKWIRGVCKRNKISSRVVTHQSQQDNSTVGELYKKVTNYLAEAKQKTAGLGAQFIFNMDETPIYFDMTKTRTLHFKGEKTVDGLDSGHLKNRYTLVLCVSASGTIVRTLLILKGLKKVPKLNLPPNIDVTVSQGGSMTTEIMLRWVENCFKRRGKYFATQKSVLFMDNYGSHRQESVKKALKEHCNTEVVFIPPKTTSYLQPCDVSLNAPLKNGLRTEWHEWFAEGSQEFTPQGYRKKPSYQHLVDMVVLSLEKLSSQIIRRSFECCGIAEMGGEIEKEKLNTRLKSVLQAGEADEETRASNCRKVLQGLEEEEVESDEETSDTELVQCVGDEDESSSDSDDDN